MKVIDVLRLMNNYDSIRVHGASDLEWGDENPNLWEPTRVDDLGWLLVEKLASRNVIEIASDFAEKDGKTVSCLTLVYR